MSRPQHWLEILGIKPGNCVLGREGWIFPCWKGFCEFWHQKVNRLLLADVAKEYWYNCDAHIYLNFYIELGKNCTFLHTCKIQRFVITCKTCTKKAWWFKIRLNKVVMRHRRYHKYFNNRHIFWFIANVQLMCRGLWKIWESKKYTFTCY